MVMRSTNRSGGPDQAPPRAPLFVDVGQALDQLATMSREERLGVVWTDHAQPAAA
jgi:hypothetical protein